VFALYNINLQFSHEASLNLYNVLRSYRRTWLRHLYRIDCRLMCLVLYVWYLLGNILIRTYICLVVLRKHLTFPMLVLTSLFLDVFIPYQMLPFLVVILCSMYIPAELYLLLYCWSKRFTSLTVYSQYFVFGSLLKKFFQTSVLFILYV